jgi:protein SCO1
MLANRFRPLAVALATVMIAGSQAAAHHPADLEGDLSKRERYFQPLEGDAAPDFTLEDADGREVSLEDFRGKVVVLHFIYAGCPDECPLHTDLIARVQEMVNRTPMRDLVQFVTITTDPERDTPEVLKAYGPAHGLDPANWVFLTSGPERPEATRDLVQRFGHRFAATEDGHQLHGIVTHVLDREGRWRANFHGLKFEPMNLVSYINALTNDHHGPGPDAPTAGAWLPLALGGLGLASLTVAAVPLYRAVRRRAR